MNSQSPIRIAAALLCDPSGRILLVRKRGAEAFMQPGGKIDPGEAPDAALIRELREELGLEVDPRRLTPLGRFAAPAANEPGRIVEADLFRLTIAGVVSPSAEIEEIAWLEASQPGELILAPLTRDHVLPLQAAAEKLRLTESADEAGDAVTLWRPVGPEELALIHQSGMRAFPPRLPDQPIFYPVLSEDYAVKIARDWNVPASGVGFVTQFKIRKSFLDGYAPQEAGGRAHREYWIPAEDLAAFNEAIVGRIEVVAQFP